MDNKPPLIITGMHRSGTSLLARFTHHSGINLGDELAGAKKSNKYGHFEDVEILEFQRNILLREFGNQMWVPAPPRLTDVDRTKAVELILARQNKPYWGWKEPRTCLFLDFWDDLLPDARYLFVVRHPLLVLDSLSRRTGTKFYHFWRHNVFLKAWLVYNRECFRFYREHCSRCILVLLDQVLQTPDSFISLLSDWLAYEFDAQVFRELYDPTALTRTRKRSLLVSPVLCWESLTLYGKLEKGR